MEHLPESLDRVMQHNIIQYNEWMSDLLHKGKVCVEQDRTFNACRSEESNRSGFDRPAEVHPKIRLQKTEPSTLQVWMVPQK